MKAGRLKRILIMTIVLSMCVAAFVMSAFANSNSVGSEVIDSISDLSKGETVCIGKNNGQVLQWQIADSDYQYNETLKYNKGILLISKYLLAADSTTGTAAGTYSQALSTIANLYNSSLNTIEKDILLSTALSDQEYTLVNSDEFEDEEGDTYDGYATNESYAVLSPDKNQVFKSKSDASSEFNSKMFLLSTEEVQKYIVNDVGTELTGLTSVVRRPSFYKFAVPADYTSGTLDNRDWWLRSEYKTTESNRAVVQRVIRKDQIKYNSLNTYGLIGHRSETDTAWLRPALATSKYNSKVSFIYRAQLTTESGSKFVSNTTNVESKFLDAMKTQVSSAQADNNYGNAWMLAYNSLPEITITNVSISNGKASFKVSGEGDNTIGYFVYSSGIYGTMGKLRQYGCASKNAAGKYVINGVTTDDYIYAFSYKVDEDNTIEASTRIRVQVKEDRSAAKISTDLLITGRKLIINNKNYVLYDADNVDQSSDVNFIDESGNPFDKNSDNGLFIGVSNMAELGSYTGPTTLSTIQKKGIAKRLSFLYPYTKDPEAWEKPDHGDYYKESRLGTDIEGTRQYAYLMSTSQLKSAGFDTSEVWARDINDYSQSVSKYLAPVFNLIKSKVAFVYKSGTLDDQGNYYLREVQNSYTQDKYEMAMTLPSDEDNFKYVGIDDYDSNSNMIRLEVEGVQSDVQGYKSSVAIIGVQSDGTIRYYTHALCQEYDNKTFCMIRLPYDYTELKYTTLYVYNELQGYDEDTSTYINGTRFVSSLYKIDLKFTMGSIKINGDNYPTGTVRAQLSSDSNISLDDPDTSVKWILSKSGTTASTTYGKTYTIPEDFMIDDWSIRVEVSNKNSIGDLLTYVEVVEIPESAKRKTITDDISKLTTGDTIYFGDIKDSSHSVWSGTTAIPWTVISRDSGNATGSDDKLSNGSEEVANGDGMLLLSRYSLDNIYYNRMDKAYDVNYAQWNDSDLQLWCRNFTKDTANVENGELEASLYLFKNDAAVQLFNGAHWAANQVPNDRFFMLSVEEISNYLAPEIISSEEDEAKRTANDMDDKATTWWARSTHPKSQGTVSVSAGIVNEKGEVVSNDVFYPNGTRPALNINKNLVAMYSYAVNGKNSNLPQISDNIQVGDISINPASGAEQDKWKLTIFDSAHKEFAVENSTAVYNNDGTRTYTFTYSGAKTGSSEFISLIRKDKNGKIIGYHKITVSNKASGTIVFTAPKADPTDQDYILNEQCNGNYQTDYCSQFAKLNGQVSAPLYITFNGMDNNTTTRESMLLEIAGIDGDRTDPITVAIPSGTEVKVIGLIEGHSYYIRRISSWSWRYPRIATLSTGGMVVDGYGWLDGDVMKVKLTNITTEYDRHNIECDMSRNYLPKWLCGENYDTSTLKTR